MIIVNKYFRFYDWDKFFFLVESSIVSKVMSISFDISMIGNFVIDSNDCLLFGEVCFYLIIFGDVFF